MKSLLARKQSLSEMNSFCLSKMFWFPSRSHCTSSTQHPAHYFNPSSLLLKNLQIPVLPHFVFVFQQHPLMAMHLPTSSEPGDQTGLLQTQVLSRKQLPWGTHTHPESHPGFHREAQVPSKSKENTVGWKPDLRNYILMRHLGTDLKRPEGKLSEN